MKRILLALMAVAIIAGCEKEEGGNLVLNYKDVILYHGEEWQIETSESSGTSFSSSNEYHAKVSENGLIKAMFVGEADITVASGKKTETVHVTVRPKNTKFKEPLFDFNLTRSEIISRLGTPDSETDEMIMYKETNTLLYGYAFGSNGKLSNAMFATTLSNAADVVEFLAERYLPISVDPALFVNSLDPKTVTMEVSINLDSGLTMVLYLPYEAKTKSTDIANGFKQLIADTLN